MDLSLKIITINKINAVYSVIDSRLNITILSLRLRIIELAKEVIKLRPANVRKYLIRFITYTLGLRLIWFVYIS